MTPARGIGANIALRDADLLRRKLMTAHHGGAPLLQALEAYELEVIAYAFKAVRESAQALQMFVAEGPLPSSKPNTETFPAAVGR